MSNYFSPKRCVECEKKCLEHRHDGGYTVDIKPTNWSCDNAKALGATNAVKGGYYRFNAGGWFKEYLARALMTNSNERG